MLPGPFIYIRKAAVNCFFCVYLSSRPGIFASARTDCRAISRKTYILVPLLLPFLLVRSGSVSGTFIRQKDVIV